MKSFSSGEVAKICDVTSRTVIRWIEAGRLSAFKLPGRGNNRVSESALLSFLEQNKMPIPHQLSQQEDANCVIVTQDQYLLKHARRMVREADYVVSVFNTGIEAGFEIALKKPSLIILDEDVDHAAPRQLQNHIEKTLNYGPNYIVFSSQAKAAKHSEAKLVYLAKPVSLNAFSQALEQVLNGESAVS